MSQVPPYTTEVIHEETAAAADAPLVGHTVRTGTVVDPVTGYAAPAVADPLVAGAPVVAAEPVLARAPMVAAAPVVPAAGYTRVTRSASVVGNPDAWRARQIVWYVLALVETLIGLRVLLLALGANPRAGFTRFIYDLSGPFVAPFRAMFTDQNMGSTGVLEVGSLVGMLVYALFAYLVVRLIDILATPRTPRPV